jgi:DHA1 family bicyclomycin/chloramphenicol resistance-like MFS transporter
MRVDLCDVGAENARSMSASSPPAPAATPLGLILLLGGLTAFGPLSIDLYLPALPQMTADLKAGAAEGQASVAAFFAGMAIGQFIYGPGSDRFGRKPLILIGIGVFLAATVVCALATEPRVLIAGRFVQALGACSGMVVARAVVRDLFSQQDTARVLSLLTLVMGVAPILAPLFGGLVLQVASWRTVFWLMFAYGLALGLATLLRLKETLTPQAKAAARGERVITGFIALARSRRLVGYILAAALNGAALFSYIAASPEIIIGLYEVPTAWFGVVFGMNAVAVIGASQINRMLLRRWTSDQVLARASLSGIASSLLLMVFATTQIGGPWTVLPLLFLTLSTYGFMAGNTVAGALGVDPARAGSISAMVGGASFGVGALAATIGGAFHDGTAGPLAIIMFVALVGSASALYGLAFSRPSAD